MKPSNAKLLALMLVVPVCVLLASVFFPVHVPLGKHGIAFGGEYSDFYGSIGGHEPPQPGLEVRRVFDPRHGGQSWRATFRVGPWYYELAGW
jgi:hypothetical protein